MNYCIRGRAKVFFFGQDDSARPNTNLEMRHKISADKGLLQPFMLLARTGGALAPAGEDDDAASLQDNAADSATLAAGGGRPFHRRATRG